ncbi:hypothetical protein HPHPP3B_0626 [Helicobacter pylori Hp P-3b]|nr:hypothetical protein HPHPP3B_0626 [Helicobacter pylori Hp P-3b]
MKPFSPHNKPPKDRIFKRLAFALRKAFLYLLDKFSHKLRFFHKFKLFFFFDLILGAMIISLKRKSDESDTKHH